MCNRSNVRICLATVMAFLLGAGARSADADLTFGTPTNLGPPVNSSYVEAFPSISADGLMLYFTSDRPGGYGDVDIWVTRRPTIVDDWGTPENVGPPVNTSRSEYCPCISADGLELYFGSYNRPGGYGGRYEIWMAKRPTRNDAWGMPINLGPPVNTPQLSTDGLELYFSAFNRAGGYGTDDIWVTRRATKNDPWEPPINLGPVVNSSASEDHPFLSADGLALFFSGDRGQPLHPLRPGGFGNVDMWVTTRSSISEPWGTPVNLGPIVNSTSLDGGPVISPDGFTLYFSSERPGGFGGVWGDIYQAPIIPIVDFNGDGIINSADMCIMVDYWGTNNSLCDIGPMPWGDGIVDVEDLKILAEQLFEDVNDPTLIAHWPLDEAQGGIAYNSAADCDGTLVGSPVWQPTAGIVDGALQFHGVDDYVITEPIMNPADNAFSVVVWIKGSAPGQGVLSQADGSNWLSTDSVEGHLMTELKASGRGAPGPLLSQAVITDDTWHRIGLVWDGSCRRLYVDGTEVAMDATTLSELESAEGGLYFGVGSTLAPGTFFSGLIDDIRIYNRVVSP